MLLNALEAALSRAPAPRGSTHELRSSKTMESKRPLARATSGMGEGWGEGRTVFWHRHLQAHSATHRARATSSAARANTIRTGMPILMLAGST